MPENESAVGLAITIPKEVFDNLDNLEGKIKSLETKTNEVSKNIVAAFKRMANGVSPFSKEVGKAESVLRALGKVNLVENLSGLGKSSSSIEKAASSMVEMANAANRMGDSGKYSAAAWQGLQKNIEQLETRQKSLLSTMKQYEATVSRMQAGGSGRISRQDTESYKAAQQEYALNERTIASYREKQQVIIDTQQALHAEYSVVQSLRNLEQKRTSLPEQKSREELARMNEYYRELEKTSAAAAKAQEKAAAQSAKAEEKRYQEWLKNKDAESRMQAKAAEERRRQIQEEEKMIARQQQLYNQTPQGALDSADSARTYNQRAQAMKNLEAAIKNLNRNDQDYGKTLNQLTSKYKTLKNQQDQVTASMGQMQQRQSNLMDISGQLMRRLALVFSVSQVTQYVQKLAQVRGEFELQNAALAAIMQNKDQADQLFSQITQLAVQSPFNLKELVTYTKELAAYRIENEKLYDTTKMLADVSAGLGVDMSRLILAYGQVKAANYLRGTELRQFSEAGINILGELATYFSELENRAVSVGEVFDMVSRRMVTFQDVEQIFQRITSEGGIFANMQEVQARTLSGMISNLQDSVDIMLNDIGQESEGALKGAVTLMRELVENWRTVASIGKAVLIPLLSYKALMTTIVFLNRQYNKMQTMHISLLRLIVSWKKKERLVQEGLNVAAKANPYILIGTAIIGTVTAIVSAIRNAIREQEEFNKTLTEGATKATELSANFERLANIAVSDTSSAEEQTAAIAEMNRTYGELIPSQYRNAKALKEMQGDYSAVTAAIYDKIDAQTREKLVQDALTEAGEDSGKWTDKIIDRLEKYGISADSATVITREFQERLKNGDYSTASEAIVGLRNIIKDFAGEAANAAIPIGALEKPANKLFKIFSSLKDTLDKISDMEFGPFRIGGGSRVYEEYSEQLKEIVATTDEYKKKLEQDGFLKFKYSIELDEAAKDAQIKAIQDFIDSLQAQIDRGEIKAEDVASVENVIDDARKAIDKIRISDRIDEIQDLRVELSRLTGVDFGKLNITQMLPTESDAEYIKKIQQEVKSMKETIDLFDEAAAQGEVIPQMQQDSLIGIGNTIENYTKTYQALLAFLERIAFTPDETKKGGKGKDEEEERIKKIIAMLKEMRSQYKKLREEYAEDEATQMIRTSYEATATDLGVQDFVTTMTFDTSGIIDGVKRISETTRDEYDKFWNEYTDSLNTEVGLELRVKNREAIQEDIDSLFTDYQMTLELEKLGGDRDIAELLGIDFTSLEDLKIKGDVQAIRLEAIGSEEALKQARELREKISNEEDKRLEENTKKYYQYLNESKDRRILIEEEAQRKIKEIQESRLTEEQKQQATANVQRDMRQALAEYDWDQFKDTDLYRMAFEDLERVGTGTLDILIRKLQEFSETSGRAMSTEDFRELMNSMKNARDELEQRNPWKTLLNSIQDYRDATANLKSARVEQTAAQEDVDFRTQERDAAREEVDSAQADYDKAQSLEERVAALERLVAAQNRLEGATTSLEEAQKALAVAEGKVVKAENEQQSSATSMINVLNSVSSTYSSMVSGINGLIDSFMELAEGMGLVVDDDTKAAIEGFQKGFSVLGSIMSTLIPIITAITVEGTAMMATLWSLLAVGAALGAVFAIIKVHDARRQKVIDAELDKIENLQDAYDDLTDSLDDVTSIRGLETYKRDLDRNIDQQIASYDRAIAAEKDKKNPDEEQIAQWEKEQEELLKQGAEDLEAALVQAGGIARDEYLSTTEDFVDAWLEAFKETGNGLSGLEDNFKDFFLNILKRQAALQVSDMFMKPIIDDINTALSDSYMSEGEAQSIIERAKEIWPVMSEWLEEYFGAFGDLTEQTSDELSGLQKGIQGITEETAQALEALLNSVRYYTADSNMQLRNIYAILSGTSDIATNPMLAELRSQTQMMTAINRLLNSVVKAGHPEGGSGIRVFMN